MLDPKNVSNGEEQHEYFKSQPHLRRQAKKMYCQYDYRHTNGVLFSCVKPTLEACRQARDEWLNGQKA
jgi:hypothetical protein